MMKFVNHMEVKAKKLNLRYLIITSIFIAFSNLLSSQILDKPYLAPPKDYTPQIYKYIFTPASDNIAPKQVSQETKQKKIQSILNDSTENSMNVNYDNSREVTGLTVKVKDGSKKIHISIYNLIGNKVADVYNKIPSTSGPTEIEIVEFKDMIDKLSNGVYICVLQGHNYRLMEKFTISR